MKDPGTRVRRSSGFTIYELGVALVIGSVVMLAAGTLADRTMRAVQAETIALTVQQAGMRALSTLGDEIATADVRAVAPGGIAVLRFAVPVDVGEDTDGDLKLGVDEDADGDGILDLRDGDYTDPQGTVQWGAIEATGPRLDTVASPHEISVAFLSQEVVQERVVGTDINSDGDLADVFRRGSLRYQTTDGRVLDLGQGMVIQVSGDPRGDIDGDGTADPLFSMEGEPFDDLDGNGTWSQGEAFNDLDGDGRWDGRVRVRLWLWAPSDDGSPVFATYSKTWRVHAQ